MLFTSDLNWFFENLTNEKETLFDVAKKLLDFAHSGGCNCEGLDLQNFAKDNKDVIWQYFEKRFNEYREIFFDWEGITPADIANNYVFELVGNYESELLTVAKVGEILKCNS